MNMKELLEKEPDYVLDALYIQSQILQFQSNGLAIAVQTNGFWRNMPEAIESISVCKFSALSHYEYDSQYVSGYEIVGMTLTDNEELLQKIIKEYSDKKGYSWKTRKDILDNPPFFAELRKLANLYSLIWRDRTTATSSRKDIQKTEALIKRYKHLAKETYEAAMDLP